MHRTDIITKRIIVISMENKSQRYSVHEKEHMHVTSANAFDPANIALSIWNGKCAANERKKNLNWNKIKTHTKKRAKQRKKKSTAIRNKSEKKATR